MTSVSSNSRFGLTFFLATTVHAAVVLGLSFGLQEKPAPPKTLEVTLATYKSKDKPEDADYLAQFNQEGSGTLEEKAKPETDQKAEFQTNQINDVELKSQEAAAPKQEKQEKQQITQISTRAENERKTPEKTDIKKTTPDKPEEVKPHKKIDIRQAVSSLEARLSKQRQEYAKRPKTKRLTSASTSQESGAYYADSWRRKVERVGNTNYPAQARKDKLYGELRLLVAINRDGTIHDVELMESSGSTILDDAAIRIVKLAAPYSPFGNDLRDYDRLEIIRTWRFERGNSLFGN